MSAPSIEELRDSIEYLTYRDTYSRILHEILGLPLAHGKREVDRLLREESFRVWFGHTSPARHAAPAIASKCMEPSLRKLVGDAVGNANLCREFAEAIEGSGDDYDQHPDTNPNYDWGACRGRIRQIVSRYEHQFPAG